MCFRFIPNSFEAAELRGGPFFREWRKEFFSPHRCILTAPQKSAVLHVNPCETWFVTMPHHRDTANYICSGTIPTVVDYYGDVLGLLVRKMAPLAMSLDSVIPLGMDLAGLTVTPEAWEFWEADNHQTSLRRSLEAAQIVTTPWPALVDPLREINPNVMLVPDYQEFIGGLAFRGAWPQVASLLSIQKT